MTKRWYLSSLILIFVITAARASNDWVYPGEPWPDQSGRQLQVHGGGILVSKGTFYWFGEDRSPGLDTNRRYVSCYASDDLVHWRFSGRVLSLGDPEHLGPTRIVERPKVYFNRKTQMYVMYLHIDGPETGMKGDYNLARVGVAVCATVNGSYRYLKSFRPLGHESRDIGQFVDDDGTAYLIFEDRPFGFRIGKLTPDYLSVENEVCLVGEHLEGCAMIHYDGLYYFVGSQLTGWSPNSNKYAVATRLEGPWSAFKDLAPPETNTYGAQSSFLLKVTGSAGTTVIFIGDLWKPNALWDSRYFWMPVEIGHGKMTLSPPRPWRLDLAKGLPFYK